MRSLGPWRWQALGWWKGGQIPLLLSVFLGEVLFITPMRGVSWRATVQALPVMLSLAGALTALLIRLARQGRSGSRDFLRTLPLAPGVPARMEFAGDLAIALAWASVWPILVPTRPHVAGLWALAHLWGAAVGILASRSGLVFTALAGASGPVLAAAFGVLKSPLDWERGLWPSGAVALACLAAAALIPAALASLPEASGERGSAWTGLRLPLPFRPRVLEVFLARGNLPLLAGWAFAAAFAAFVIGGSRALENFSPRLVSVLVGVGMSVPLALGLSAPVQEFLMTRPVSRRRLLASAMALGCVTALLAPAAGLLALSRTTDEALDARVDRAIRSRLLEVSWSTSEEVPRERLRAIVREVLFVETGLKDHDLDHPRYTRTEFLSAVRTRQRHGWLSAGLLGLLWFAVGFWVRMRYEAGQGSRGVEVLTLLPLLAVTSPELAELGWRTPWPACPLPLLALGVAAVAIWIWTDLKALETR